MYVKSADWYDLLHEKKDYAAEAKLVAEVVETFRPGARDLLDVACGTGGHLRYFRESFDCHGIDLDAGLLKVAGERLPDVSFTKADMTDFDLDRRFDAITCLFSAIGYVRSTENLRSAIARMADHLRPGGVLIVEPWILPENWDDWVARTSNYCVACDGDLTVGRFRATRREGTMTELLLHYIATDDKEVVVTEERHQVRMFTVDELTDAASRAGLNAKWDPIGITGRGFLIGVRPND